jgi:hypothetical protein
MIPTAHVYAISARGATAISSREGRHEKEGIDDLGAQGCLPGADREERLRGLEDHLIASVYHGQVCCEEWKARGAGLYRSTRALLHTRQEWLPRACVRAHGLHVAGAGEVIHGSTGGEDER